MTTIRHRLAAALAGALLFAAGAATGATPAAAADPPTCGTIIGMSQIRNAYQGSTLAATGRVELNWSPGTRLGNWANPTSRLWADVRTENDCGDPTWAAFGFDPLPVAQLDGYAGSNQPRLDDLLDRAVANIRDRWPTIDQLDLWLLVGGPDDEADHSTVCSLGATVRATELHQKVYAGLVDYLERHPEVGAGPDIHVGCDGFADSIGHLNTAGQLDAGGQLDAAYLDPEPTTTTTEPTTTTEACTP